ncbi:MurR/RpiR family transcriptional regulator [Actinocrinis puniceicyclus]|uniref:MurR/RpiR family transcriptional regulator n=1 Tax=Actinocrinis puniceicyclus TaxID=977794 RepID=A0A8J8BB71_9ACTN|nr:MurR/RpiR family transcriptional regulator [Actinocrinis puniceicyclus]MBS2962155.1 MurR/RpiR family transcriptional regulator [Actinocrinis puniceicyclus]
MPDPTGFLDAPASSTEQVLGLLDGRRLSPAQRRIGQFLIDHLAEVVFMSSVDLAERVGVSQPSVTRFAAALGFSGYPALRDALKGIVLGSVGESPEEVRRNEFQAAIAAEQANLAALQRLAAVPDRLIETGRLLADSTPLAVLGLRLSQPVAHYFAYSAQRVHPDVRLVGSAGTAADDALLQARQAGARWLVAFVLPRYAREALTAIQHARALGLKILLVTDNPLVPFAGSADVLLPAAVGSRLVFDSHAAPIVLASLLVQAIADAAPERTQARLEAYESLSETHAFYS